VDLLASNLDLLVSILAMTENMKVMTGCSSAKLVSKQEKWDCTLVTLDCTLEKKVNSWERMENNAL